MLYQIQTLDAECSAAFKSVRAAKNWFMFLAVLTILAVPFSTVMVKFAGVLNPPAVAPATMPASQAATMPASAPASSPASAPAAEPAKSSIAAWRCALQCVLTASGILAPMVAVLLVITLFVAGMVSIIARSGGIGSFFNAFFWSIVLLAMLLPWQHIFPGTMTSGISVSLAQLEYAMRQMDENSMSSLCFYFQFLAYPLVALLVWVLAQVKFARGYGAMDFSTSVAVDKPVAADAAGADASAADRPTEPPNVAP